MSLLLCKKEKENCQKNFTHIVKPLNNQMKSDLTRKIDPNYEN